MKLLLSELQIQERIQSLAREIENSVTNSKVGIVLLGVLKGSIYFFTDLSKNLRIHHEIDFIRVSSYGMNASSKGRVELLYDPTISLAGKDVFIIEDIVDTGLTTRFLIRHLMTFDPASLKLVSLLKKKNKSGIEFNIDYLGFEIEDEFVVGYGLDYQEKDRHHKDIFTIDNIEKKDTN
jgi:hypoxanthine phosphoribosyltransferase